MKKSELQKMIKEIIQESFNWDYFYLKNGIIVDKSGKKAFVDSDNKGFRSIQDAEEWLYKKNYRGNVVGDFSNRHKKEELSLTLPD